MKQFIRIRNWLVIGIIAVLIVIPVYVWLVCKSIVTTGIIGFMNGIVILLIVCLVICYDKYMSKMVNQLSDLISTITQMQDEIIFPENEDILLSKLQNQVIKLSGIWKAQNRAIEKEKNEIKLLISDISHQLKTPISTLKIYGELLMDKTIANEEREEYLENIRNSLNKLTFLTDSLIKMSRLESGIIQLNPQINNYSETILDAIMQAYHMAKSKEIEIAFESDGQFFVLHDKRWTAEAIFNIIDNAVKYTNKNGKIEISLKKYEIFTRLDIKDNGIGILEEELANIFHRFYRGKNTHNEDGVGIGLYLSRKIIIKQGGYIKVKSDKEGSVFSVFLPAN